MHKTKNMQAAVANKYVCTLTSTYCLPFDPLDLSITWTRTGNETEFKTSVNRMHNRNICSLLKPKHKAIVEEIICIDFVGIRTFYGWSDGIRKCQYIRLIKKYFCEDKITLLTSIINLRRKLNCGRSANNLYFKLVNLYYKAVYALTSDWCGTLMSVCWHYVFLILIISHRLEALMEKYSETL